MNGAILTAAKRKEQRVSGVGFRNKEKTVGGGSVGGGQVIASVEVIAEYVATLGK